MQTRDRLLQAGFTGLLIITMVASGSSSTMDVLSKTPSFLYANVFRFLAFFLSICFLVSLYGIGSQLRFLLLKKEKVYPLEKVMRFFLGYLTGAVLIYAMGFTQTLNPWVYIVFFVIGFLIAIRKFSFDSIKSRLTAISDYWRDISLFERIVWFVAFLFFVSRLVFTLHHNTFGDPLYYCLPAGRDYLNLGGFNWVDYEDFYAHMGLADFMLIYLHSISSNPLFVQITAQTFYLFIGPVLLFYILHFTFFSDIGAAKHSLWISFSLVCIGFFRLESIIAKPDYFLMVNFVLIIVVAYQIYKDDDADINLSLWKFLLLTTALCITIKTTSAFFLPPLGIAILIVLFKKIPFTNKSFLSFILIFVLLSSLNFAKNYYIFKNPLYPFANEIFQSPYWDDVGTGMLEGIYSLKASSFKDYVFRLGYMLTGYPSGILFLVLCGLGVVARRVSLSFKSNQLSAFLMLLLICWVGCGFIWFKFMSPQMYLRFIIAFVYLNFLLCAFLFAFCFSKSFQNKNSKGILGVGIVSLLLSISVSNVDVRPLKLIFSNQSYEQHWLDSSVGIAEVQNYLNQKSDMSTNVLVYDRGQRFHAKFTVYGSREESPRTRFVYSNDEKTIDEGLARLGIDYYLHWKRYANIPNRPMTHRSFLDAKFEFEKELRSFVVYKVNL